MSNSTRKRMMASEKTARKQAGSVSTDTKAVVAPYEPEPREKAVIDELQEHRRSRPPDARIKVEQKRGTAQIGVDHPDQRTGSALLMKATGTTSNDFLSPFVGQLANAGSKGGAIDEEGTNFMLAVVKAIEPKDEIEAMLAAQMAAVHMATMTFARRLNHVDNIPQQDSAERAFNKLARTFATQMEALKRYRSGGQQKVTVEHVHVHAGGQAIVGAVEAGGGVANENQRQPHAKAISHASEPPLWSEDPEREPVPVPGDAER
jgi:hypothetical protein